MSNLPTFPKNLLEWIHQFPLSMAERPDWDHYFLMQAFIVSRRSSCLRTKVGAVIVRDKDVISVGYNGAPRPQKNCLDLGNCYRDTHHIKSGTQLEACRASGSHAESNAIVLAAKNGHSTLGATIYIYGHQFVCNMCRGMIANAHIARVVHLKDTGEIEEFDVDQEWTVNQID